MGYKSSPPTSAPGTPQISGASATPAHAATTSNEDDDAFPTPAFSQSVSSLPMLAGNHRSQSGSVTSDLNDCSSARLHSSCTRSSSSNSSSSSDHQGWSEDDEDGGREFARSGLIRDGSTCYLNSLLQVFFHTGRFRSCVYRTPIHRMAQQQQQAPTHRVAAALQELFYLMQAHPGPNRTTRLTEAFGWRKEDLHIQQDVQELAALLRDRLEQVMKGSEVADAMNELFRGRGEMTVQTLNQSFTSRSPDLFYDIHLPVDGFGDLMSSLESLTAAEKLAGENRYCVEEEGKAPTYMDAVRRYRFLMFPPVVWFHLKRFTVGPSMTMQKVYSRFSFPRVLDLSSLEGEPPVVDGVGPSSPIYDLHAVIVHRGTFGCGHYFTYIREWNEEEQQLGRWFCYDDESVREVSTEEAVESSFGSVAAGNSYSTASPLLMEDAAAATATGTAMAYVVAYVRRSAAPSVLTIPHTRELGGELRALVRQELEAEAKAMKAEQARRESLELHIITNRGLSECTASQSTYAGFRLPSTAGSNDEKSSLCFPVDFALEVRQTDLIQSVYEALLQHPFFSERGLTAELVRLWKWDPLSGGCALEDRSWSAAACVALPSYEECRQHTSSFSAFIPAAQHYRPACMYLYIQEPSPFTHLFPTLHVDPMVRRFRSIEAGTYKISLRRPMRLNAISLVLAGGRGVSHAPLFGAAPSPFKPSSSLTGASSSTTSEEASCGVELHLLNTTTGDFTSLPLHWCGLLNHSPILHLPIRRNSFGPQHQLLPFPRRSEIPELIDDITISCKQWKVPPPPSPSLVPTPGPHLSKEHQQPAKKASAGGSPPPATVPSRILDVHLHISQSHLRSVVTEPPDDMTGDLRYDCSCSNLEVNSSVSFGFTSSLGVNSVTATALQLAAPGTDRILLFFKLFDYMTCSVRYIGSSLVDRCATLKSCEMFIYRMLGFPHVEYMEGSSSRHQLAFYVEEVGEVWRREVKSSDDLWTSRLSSGSVIVVQYRNTPPLYRHTFISSFTTSVSNDVLVRVIHMKSRVLENCGMVREAISRQHQMFRTQVARRQGSCTAATERRKQRLSLSQNEDPQQNESSAGVEALPDNPYQYAMPVLCPVVYDNVCSVVRCMNRAWTYLPLCDCVSAALQLNLSSLQVFQAVTPSILSMMPIPTNSTATLAQLVNVPAAPPHQLHQAASDASGGGGGNTVSGGDTPAVLFAEEVGMREEAATGISQRGACRVVITLRDAAGRPLHRTPHLLVGSMTLAEVVKMVVANVAEWEREENVYGSLLPTLAATHFLFALQDWQLHKMVRLEEVDLAEGPSGQQLTVKDVLFSLLTPSSLKLGKEAVFTPPRLYTISVQPGAPLKEGERRVACCHIRCSSKTDVQHHSTPFAITINPHMTVKAVFERMVEATHVSLAELQSPPASMMLMTNTVHVFRHWEPVVETFLKRAVAVAHDVIPHLALNYRFREPLTRSPVVRGEDPPSLPLPSSPYQRTLTLPE